MVKDQVKECWHENVTQCHDTYVTEFLPSQEQKCEETFWKSCKIDFKEAPYNYTMKQCHTPLVKECDSRPSYNTKDAEIVCKTWFESECNTTFVEQGPTKNDLPNTWCKKVPRKICAPDNCRMVPGPEECSNKMMVSTIQKPSEVCDLQPQRHCRLITRLVPHLLQKEVCRNVPKEMCHLALANPHLVKKPMRLKWCTKSPPKEAYKAKPSYKPPPSYLPPSKRSNPSQTTALPTGPQYSAAPVNAVPSSSAPIFTTLRPTIQFQRRSHQDAYETKFKPIALKAEPQEQKIPQHILIEDFFVQNSAEDLELITKSHAEPLVASTTKPTSYAKTAAAAASEAEMAASDLSDATSAEEDYNHLNKITRFVPRLPITEEEEKKESLQLPKLASTTSSASMPLLSPNIDKVMPPRLPASISDELSGFDSFSSGFGLDSIHNPSHIGEASLKRK